MDPRKSAGKVNAATPTTGSVRFPRNPGGSSHDILTVQNPVPGA